MFWILFLFPSIFGADDPEATMNTMEILMYWGYPAEAISVTTDDGYILEMHRVEHGIHGKPSKCRPVVFLMTGLLAESSIWLKLTPEQSFATMLADAGFDVFMGNYRGSSYGRLHTRLKDKEGAFWRFSWDQMAQYDLPALIDKTLAITGERSLYYIGHSQGTLVMFAKLASDPNFASKIRAHFALTPIGSMVHAKGLMRVLARTFRPVIRPAFRLYGDRALLPDMNIIDTYKRFQCKLTSPICALFISMIAGPESDQFNRTHIQVIMKNFPSGTSARNVQHWAQLINGDGMVRKFDFGKRKNEEKYGVPIPPFYDYSTITTDTYVYWGEDDYLSAPEDVEGSVLVWLRRNIVKEEHRLSGFTHFDFAIGTRAPYEVYRPIIAKLNNLADWTCNGS